MTKFITVILGELILGELPPESSISKVIERQSHLSALHSFPFPHFSTLIKAQKGALRSVAFLCVPLRSVVLRYHIRRKGSRTRVAKTC